MKRFNSLTTISPITLIDGSAALLVIFLALAALGISFANLALLAGVNGFQPWEANLWAGQVDGFIVVATLAVLRAHLTGARARYAWGLVLGTTVTSVLFNAFHAYTAPWLAVIMRGLPPVTLFLSFHLLMGFVGEWVAKRTLVQTRAELEGQVSALAGQLADMETAHADRLADMDKDVQTRTDKLETIKAERAALTKDVRDTRRELSEILGQLDTARTALSNLSAPEVGHDGDALAYVWTSADERRGHVLRLANDGRTPGEIAGLMSPTVNEKTIRRDILALNGQVQHG